MFDSVTVLYASFSESWCRQLFTYFMLVQHCNTNRPTRQTIKRLGVLTKRITIVNRNKINVSEKLKIGLNVFYLHVSWHTQYLPKLVTVLQVH